MAKLLVEDKKLRHFIPRIRQRRRWNRGQALVFVLLLTLITYVVGLAIWLPARHGLSASWYGEQSAKAQNIAEAGLDLAVAALNTTITQGDAPGALPTFFAAEGTGRWRYLDGANGQFFRTQFGDAAPSIVITQPVAVPLPGGGRPEDYRIVESQAVVHGSRRHLRAIIALQQNTVTALRSAFSRAITTAGDLDSRGNTGALRTDSYDSAAGFYGGSNVGTSGGVHANGNILGGGQYFGNVSAVGNIDGAVVASGSGNATVSGAPVESLPSLPAPPEPSTPYAWQSGETLFPPAGQRYDLGDVVLSGGQQLILTPGAYGIGRLQTSGNAQVTILGGGLTDLYVSGSVSVTGNGIVTTGMRPTDLRLMVMTPGVPVLLAGNGDFYGLVQAPGNAVTIGGNGAFYGALVAQQAAFSGGNCSLHYDEAAGRGFLQPMSRQLPVAFRFVAVDILPASAPSP